MNEKTLKQKVGAGNNKHDEVVRSHHKFYFSSNVDKSFDRRKNIQTL